MKLPRHHEAVPVRPMTERERTELRACEVAREVGFSSRSGPRGRAFVRHYDATRREWYEEAVYTWARGTVRVDSRTMDVTIERTP